MKMKVIKTVSKKDMVKAMEREAKNSYAACSNDCPRCRISDG